MAQEICDGCIVVKVDVDVEANVHVCCVVKKIAFGNIV
jgi:hypothetical protein